MNDEFKSQLTALALNELTQDERQALESAPELTPEARKYAADTKAFCAVLSESLGTPATVALTDDQRIALIRDLSGTGADLTVVKTAPPRGNWFAWTMGLGAAAAVVLVSNQLWQERGTSEVAGLSQPGSESAGVLRGGTPEDGFDRFAGLPIVDGETRDAAGGAAGAGDRLLAEQSIDERRSDASLQPDASTSLGNRVALSRAKNLSDESRVRELAATSLDSLSALNSSLAKKDHFGTEPLATDSLLADLPADPAGSAEPGAKALYAEADQSGREFRSRQLLTAENAPAEESAVPASGPVVADAASATSSVNESLEQARGLSLLTPAAPAPAPEKPAAGAATRGGLDDVSQIPRERLSLAKAELGEAQAAMPEAKAADSYSRFSKEKQVTDLEKHSDFKSATPLGRTALEAEAYEEVPENPFLAVATAPLSTFSIDVDTAGYANVRRFLNQGQRPPKAAVRLEEMVNYFRYDYPQPAGDTPFSVTVDVADCPWQPQHRLARIGLQGKQVAREQRPAANLVFLVDVSGSMDEPNKLPLVRQSLHLLTSQLKGSDHVAIVTYAGSSGVALPSTSLEQKDTVTRAIDALAAGGSTNGASGIQLAYQQARQNFKAGGVNRVLLATDGDFNVGLTSRDDLQKLITEEAKSGVFLSVLGYGMGNLKDATMEMLSDKGNGNYAYIDSLSEARKVLAEQVEGTLMTIAKDVKVQIEFNPAHVRNYRLLGYENRMLAKEDFNDDKKDAGEIGAGHSVTALYEIVPMSAPPVQPPVDPLKYQPPPLAAALPVAVDQPVSPETMTVKLRYKAPDGETSRLFDMPVVDQEKKFAEAPADFKFAASVAMTGLLLKDSAHKGTANWSMVRDLARAGKGPDPEGYRGEFLQLVEKAAGVAP